MDEDDSMTTVYTTGTFDLFHIGHLRLLQRAKALAGEGGRLIVGVSTDRFNEVEKGKRATIPFAERAEIVAALKCVDEVIPENNWDKRSNILKYAVDIYVIGNDWEGKFDELKDVCRVVYLPRTDGISSTELKDKIHEM